MYLVRVPIGELLLYISLHQGDDSRYPRSDVRSHLVHDDGLLKALLTRGCDRIFWTCKHAVFFTINNKPQIMSQNVPGRV